MQSDDPSGSKTKQSLQRMVDQNMFFGEIFHDDPTPGSRYNAHATGWKKLSKKEKRRRAQLNSSGLSIRSTRFDYANWEGITKIQGILHRKGSKQNIFFKENMIVQ